MAPGTMGFITAPAGGAPAEPATNDVAAPPPSPLDVLTPPQAAAYLQVGEDVIVREAEGGRIPGRKLGGEWRFLRLALSDWLRAAPGPASASPQRVVYIGGTPVGAPEME